MQEHEEVTDEHFDALIKAKKQKYIPSLKANVQRTIAMLVLGLLLGFVFTQFTDPPSNINIEEIQNWHLIDGLAKGIFITVFFFLVYAGLLIRGTLKFKREAEIEVLNEAMKRAKGRK